jgi:hypothetical protein
MKRLKRWVAASVPWPRLVLVGSTSLCAPSCDRPRVSDDAQYAMCYDGSGICLSKELVGEAASVLLESDSCAKPQLCVPRRYAQGMIPTQCTSIADSEGRCLFERLPSVAAQRDRLPRSFCAADELCVPCFDPLTGDATGACSTQGDPGPTLPVSRLGSCCAGMGRCLPPELVDATQRAQFDHDACGGDELCAPTLILEGANPAPCESWDSAEGRCLPACLAAISVQRERLPQASCAPGELCAPCYDPLNGKDTGSCRLPGDRGPTRTAQLFSTCCGGQARCLPVGLVPAGQRSMLAQGDCATEHLCVVQSLIDEHAPRGCTAFGELEGRCLSTCIPVVSAQLDRLTRASCLDTERCVPCFDPFSGEATGACSLPSDPGPVRPKELFDTCCGGGGFCLPSSLVSAEQQANVVQATCQAAQLCTPKALIDAVAPSSCVSLGGLEGRCLSDCLPFVARQGERLPRSDCAGDQRCAPCFDPLSGQSTGACSLTGDMGPSHGSTRFDKCCGGSGYCVPPELLPEDQREQLGRETCGADRLCAPELLTMGKAPESCDSIAGAEGRCLSTCLPAILTQAAQLPRSSCASDERCAPCFDPFTGHETGSCALPGDTGPVRSPVVFAECCQIEGATRGRCLPTDLIPSAKRALLVAVDCGGGDLCVPNALAPPATSLPSCFSSAGRGACVPRCLLSATQDSASLMGSCPSGEKCVPCEVLGSATGVCD